MDAPEDLVADHYGFGGLRSRIEAALEARSSHEPLTEEDVSGAAEFHIGGRAASKRVIDALGLGAGMGDGAGASVLDLGSGLGGTARLLAATTGAVVDGIDLTPEFVDVATWLSEQTGLADRTRFRVGSITAPLPWVDQFDAATMLHVGMNIADKTALAVAAHGALRPGARFAIYDVMSGPAGTDALEFPVPWAARPETSHVAAADDYAGALTAAGFSIIEIEDLSEWATQALASPARPSEVNLGLVTGPDTPAKIANMRANLAAGRIAPTLIVAQA